jgi:LuxR family maltose regulon positive regulatory protein
MTRIIPDKITVPLELPRISRHRLVEKLTNSLNTCSLTIINGRAGTGKTTLVRDFAWQCGRRVAWYKVDASDNDPLVFFRYFIASISVQWPGFGRGLTEKSLREDMPRLAESLAYELDHPIAPLVVVLDDLHLVYDAEWTVPFFGRFSPLLPLDVHLIMIGRIPPPAPLWRMRSKQTLCLIDESDLAFTSSETALLLESYGLPRSAASGVLARSQGRAAKVDAMVGQKLAEDYSINMSENVSQAVCG